MADETPFYQLPLYNTGDIANLRDNYNTAMQRIDRKLHQIDVQLSIITKTNPTTTNTVKD